MGAGAWGAARARSHRSALVVSTFYYALLNEASEHITGTHRTLTASQLSVPRFPFSWCQLTRISFSQIMAFQKNSTKSSIHLFSWNFSSKEHAWKLISVSKGQFF